MACSYFVILSWHSFIHTQSLLESINLEQGTFNREPLTRVEDIGKACKFLEIRSLFFLQRVR